MIKYTECSNKKWMLMYSLYRASYIVKAKVEKNTIYMNIVKYL